MKSITLTFDQAVAEMREIVAGREDFVYKADQRTEDGDRPTCMYYEIDGTPSCVVGHLMAKEGMSLADLLEYSSSGWVDLNKGPTAPVLHHFGILRVSGRTIDFLRDMQSAQDKGAPWGNALELALENDTWRMSNQQPQNYDAEPTDLVTAGV